jgi:hypothetical protein
VSPIHDQGPGKLVVQSLLPLRECNFFFHPQFFYPGNANNSMFAPQNDNGYTTFLYQTEPELQLQVGSKLFPEIPIRSTAES